MKKQKTKSKLWIYLTAGCILLVVALWFPVIQPLLHKFKAEHDVAELSMGLKAYTKVFGEFPPGNRAEICGALRGNNRTHEAVVEGYEMNAAHEFIDPWGSPYQMELGRGVLVYSFGPNKVDERAKGDDIVAP